ncbi:hypothetical protein EON83_27770 [bacterium]|nr:MAG: hypothetical protein EON83_27770 [bacterium]
MIYSHFTNPEEWAQGVAFVNRYEADSEILNQDDVSVPDEVVNAVCELTNVLNDLVYREGLGEEWGEDTPQNMEARRAVVRIIARMASEFALALGVEEEAPTTPDSQFDEDGRPTKAYLKKCHSTLFDVADFTQRVLKGEHMENFSSIEDTLETRRVFAHAPDALAVATMFFREGLAYDAEWSRKRYEASTAPLPPEEEAEETDDESEEGGEETAA